MSEIRLSPNQYFGTSNLALLFNTQSDPSLLNRAEIYPENPNPVTAVRTTSMITIKYLVKKVDQTSFRGLRIYV